MSRSIRLLPVLAAIREHVFFHAREQHELELEPLRAVHRHQRDLLDGLIAAGGAGKLRRINRVAAGKAGNGGAIVLVSSGAALVPSTRAASSSSRGIASI